MQRRKLSRGFTLIELLVVIAIIALLIAILLPSLGKARLAARAVKDAAAARSVSQAVLGYTVDFRVFPPSYVYGADTTSMEWNFADQLLHNPNGTGYVHWSYSLFDGGRTSEDAFKSSMLLDGGAPPTNPGSANNSLLVADQATETSTPDRQVKRIAFTGNAAIFCRNKFAGSDGNRNNVLVNPAWVDGTTRGGSGTILIAQFTDKLQYRTLMSEENLVKSHRPVSPIYGRSAGADVYGEADGGSEPRFTYPTRVRDVLGTQSPNDIVNNPINAVGRLFPGGDGYGGATVFGFVDGHVQTMPVAQTLKQQLWGDKFFSLSGDNRVNLDTVPQD